MHQNRMIHLIKQGINFVTWGPWTVSCFLLRYITNYTPSCSLESKDRRCQITNKNQKACMIPPFVYKAARQSAERLICWNFFHCCAPRIHKKIQLSTELKKMFFPRAPCSSHIHFSSSVPQEEHLSINFTLNTIVSRIY